jgi:hypothetical protein
MTRALPTVVVIALALAGGATAAQAQGLDRMK